VGCPYYVFLVSLTPKNHSRVIKLTKSKVEFGLVPAEHWNQPHWINETKASLARQRLLKNGVAYGGEFVMLIVKLSESFIIDIAQGAFRASFFFDLDPIFGYSYIIEDIGTCVDSSQE
jgi:hypothetical protein